MKVKNRDISGDRKIGGCQTMEEEENWEIRSWSGGDGNILDLDGGEGCTKF